MLELIVPMMPLLAAGIDVIDGHPAAQTRLADPEILRDLRHRRRTWMGDAEMDLILRHIDHG